MVLVWVLVLALVLLLVLILVRVSKRGKREELMLVVVRVWAGFSSLTMYLGGRGQGLTHGTPFALRIHHGSTKISSLFKRAAFPPPQAHAEAEDVPASTWKPSPTKRRGHAINKPNWTDDHDEATFSSVEQGQNDAYAPTSSPPGPTLDLSSLLSDPSWIKALEPELKSPSFKDLEDFITAEIGSTTIFPPRGDIFRAFNTTPLSKVRVCIIGQDPYYRQGQAMGLSFSAPKTQPIPHSLKNIYKEISSDLGHPISSFKHGDLSSSCDQGVLLLNAVLTVRSGEPNSHRGKGWEEVTDGAIRALSRESEGVVFILWGNFAQEKAKLIDPRRGHKILTSAHPAARGRSAFKGFCGSNCFSQANAFLEAAGEGAIDWRIEIGSIN